MSTQIEKTKQIRVRIEQTNEANTRDWLEAIKGMKISSYIQSSIGIFTREVFEEALKRVSRPLDLRPEGQSDSKKSGT